MAARLPGSGALTPAHASVGSVWHHIFLDRFPDPLGFGFASSRSSDPRRKPAKRFGVYYVGQTFEVAFLETIVRDVRNGNPGPLVLSASDLEDYVHVHITVQARLDLVDASALDRISPQPVCRPQHHSRPGQRPRPRHHAALRRGSQVLMRGCIRPAAPEAFASGALWRRKDA